MLDLDSEHWATLRQAYGDGAGVPTLIRALSAEPVQPQESELWDDIWSCLCHQGTVYTASYAAVPHMVSIAADLEPLDRVPYLVFVGRVAMSSDGPEVPAVLATAYAVAREQAEAMAQHALEARPSEEHTVVYLLQTIAALRGCKITAQLVEGLANGEFIPRCPGEMCGVELYVTIDGAEMFASVEDPATEVVSERTSVKAPAGSPARGGTLWTDDTAAAHFISLAERAGKRDLASKIHLATGTVTCPRCGVPFALWDTLLHPTDL